MPCLLLWWLLIVLRLWPDPSALVMAHLCPLCVELLCFFMPNLLTPASVVYYIWYHLLVLALRMWVLLRYTIHPFIYIGSKCLWGGSTSDLGPAAQPLSSELCPRPPATAPSSSFLCHSQVGGSHELVLISCHQALETRGGQTGFSGQILVWFCQSNATMLICL